MRPDARLWAGIVGAPLIWFTTLCTNFALAPWACSLGWKPALHVVSALALALTAACGYAAWTEWRRVGREWPGETAGPIPRRRALASGGVLLSAMSFLVIVAQTITEFLQGACQ